MKLPSLLLLFTLFFSTLSAQSGWWGKDKVRGNGQVETETRNVSGNFSELEVCCALKVMLTQANETSIEVEAEENILPLIETEVRGNRLYVGMKSGYNVNSTEPMKVFVKLPRLTEVEASGASKVLGSGTFTGSSLAVDVNGASHVELAFEGGEVDLEANGAAKITLNGRTDRLSVDVSGAASVRAQELEAKRATVDASSASSARVYVTDDLDAEASSAASVRYRGNPERINKSSNSAGSVKKM